MVKKLVITGRIRQDANRKSDSKKCADNGFKCIESKKINDPNPIKKSLKKKPEKILGIAKTANELTILIPDSPTKFKLETEKFSSPSKTNLAKLSLYNIVNKAACEINVIISNPSK